MTRADKKSTKGIMPEDAIAGRKKRLLNLDEIFLFFQRLLILIVFIIVLFGMIFGIFPVNNNDMMPRIAAGDMAVYYRINDRYVSRDLVFYSVDNKTRLGRIVACPGDEVEITKSNELMVNGFVAYEENIFYPTPGYDERVEYPVVLGSNEYFILADYRQGARDSRYYGPISDSNIRGKVVAVMRWMNL